MIEGPEPTFRCCIYKEREIVRQRIRLAEGKAPGAEDDGNIVQVIKSACADCPISSYVVTNNCQNCLGKDCIKACRFGAIEPGHTRSRIDPQKCKECGMCAKACPYNAIAHVSRPCKDSCPVDAISYDEYGVSVIDEEKCIRCGQCAAKCPFGAIGTKTWITNVIADLKAGKKVYAILAPATEGQFGKDITMESWRQAVKKAGFEDLIEAGLGGDMTTCSEAEEWLEAYRNGEKKTTSCCPGFVNMIRKHYPDLADMISTTVSPMCAVSRMIKAKIQMQLQYLWTMCSQEIRSGRPEDRRKCRLCIKLQRDLSNSESKRRRIRTSREYISGFYDLRQILWKLWWSNRFCIRVHERDRTERRYQSMQS